MSKEFENQIIDEIKSLYHKVIHAPLLKKQKNNTVKLYEPILKEHFEIIIKKYVEDKIKQALTPPTAEEVCKALSEVENLNDVKYCKHKKEFYILFNQMQFPISRPNRRNGDLEINYPLPPHLITLIGKFYKGESK